VIGRQQVKTVPEVIGPAALALLLAGCAGFAPSTCPPGLETMTEAQLFLGGNIAGGGQVSEADWQSFLDDEVTPRFPDGLTVEDAAGQWRGAGGVVREPSKRLTIVLKGSADEQSKLSAIREAYKRRFRQDSVLLLEYRGCGSF
jgi:hypothetical protein